MSAHIFGTRAMRLILHDCATTGLTPVELFRLERARTLCSLRTAMARVTRTIRATQRDPADDLVLFANVLFTPKRQRLLPCQEP